MGTSIADGVDWVRARVATKCMGMKVWLSIDTAQLHATYGHRTHALSALQQAFCMQISWSSKMGQATHVHVFFSCFVMPMRVGISCLS